MSSTAITESWRFRPSDRLSLSSVSGSHWQKIALATDSIRASANVADPLLHRSAAALSVEQAVGLPADAVTLPTVTEEFANTVTHGLGLVLSMAGFYLLLSWASVNGSLWQLVGCGVYGASLVALYTASTMYHGVVEKRSKERWRVVDHICIYLLIAGTYTPFMLISLRGPWGWTMLALVWGIALTGIAQKIRYADALDSMSAAPYVALGWFVLLIAKPLVAFVPIAGLLWLLAGGIAYTAGVIFYVNDKKPFFHAIWHLFVLAGSACHFVAVMHLIDPLV